MNIFQRILKFFQSEANSALDKLEDPIKMSEQGLLDLKRDLESSVKALAEVKAMAIRAKRDAETYQNQAEEYERKAIALLQRSESGQISPEEADRLAEAALGKKAEAETNHKRSMEDYRRFDANVTKLDAAVKKLRAEVSRFENEIKTLKARAKVSAATQRVNKQLAGIDSSSTTALLERMKEKVDRQEAESEAYAQIAGEGGTVDEEINKALGDTKAGSPANSAALNALKAKLAGKSADSSLPKSGANSPSSALNSSPASSTPVAPPSSAALEKLKSKLRDDDNEISSERIE